MNSKQTLKNSEKTLSGIVGEQMSKSELKNADSLSLRCSGRLHRDLRRAPVERRWKFSDRFAGHSSHRSSRLQVGAGRFWRGSLQGILNSEWTWLILMSCNHKVSTFALSSFMKAIFSFQNNHIFWNCLWVCIYFFFYSKNQSIFFCLFAALKYFFFFLF